jgi:urease accessory protein
MPRVRKPTRPLAATSLLKLIWLASPALPVGAFSYSEVLEAAVDAGQVTDEAGATRWLLDQLAITQARAELPVMAAAMRAWARADLTRIAELNQWVLCTRETFELRRQTEQMGHSLAAWCRERAPGDALAAALTALKPVPCWPVAWALAAVQSGAAERDALLAGAFGWAENMVQAAIKAVPLGQTAGQRMLAALADAAPAAVDAARAMPESAWQNSAPALAILSARHESQYSRLFRS